MVGEWGCIELKRTAKTKAVLSPLWLSVCAVTFIALFSRRCESKSARCRYRLKFCTHGDLITETLAPPLRRNTRISYQNLQMCPITES